MSTTAPENHARPEAAAAAMPAGAVVRSYIGAQVDELNRAIARMERYEHGSVGQTRTSIHRIRTAVRGYRDLFVRPPYGGKQLDQLLDTLKRTEDLEALGDHFAERFERLGLVVPRYPRWHGALKTLCADGYREIDRISSQAWVAALLGQVRLFASHARFTRRGTRPASSLTGVLTQAKMHLLDTYAKQAYAADLTEARDRTRLAAREALHVAEAVHPALGRASGDMLAEVTRFESLLNGHRLSAIAGTWLQRLPGADRADPLTGELAEHEHRRQRELADLVDRVAAELSERWR